MVNFKGQKGVTITTLTIYIIVSTVLLATLAFININFMSELGELTRHSKLTNEMTKFYSFFVDDIKSANKVLEFSDSYIRFDNGVKYSTKYRANKSSTDQKYDVYELYRGDMLITDRLSGVFFEYNLEEQYVRVRLSILDDDVLKTETQYFKVGRGY